MKSGINILLGIILISNNMLAQNLLFDNFSSIPKIEVLENTKFESYEFSDMDLNNHYLISKCERNMKLDSYYFKFEISEENGISIKLKTEDDIFFIISVFIESNDDFHFLTCDAFNGNKGELKILPNKYETGQLLIGKICFSTDNVPDLFKLSLSNENFDVPNSKNGISIIQGEYSIQELTDLFTSDGTIISNATYIGHPEAIGYFSNAIDIIGFEEGIIMSTGRVLDAIGPNTSGSTGTNLGQPGDSLISTIVNTTMTNDAATLAFDFTANSDILQFNYIFASEEYLEYAFSVYNDAFAFFISGGPEEYEYLNIALIPGTNTDVTINNINHVNNSQFFINNTNNTHNIEYDGYTVPFSSTVSVTPQAVYSVRITIADVADAIYDSALFLKAGSLVSDYKVKGSVYVDSNNNCEFDEDDITVPYRVVIAEPGPIYSMTNSEGVYHLFLNNGSYTVSTAIPPLFQINCFEEDFYQITIENINDFYDNIDFPLHSLYECPLLHVNIISTSLRPCMQSSYIINYSNQGMITAENVEIEVEFDEVINLISSCIPNSYIGNNTYLFEIGNLEAFEFGNINVTVSVECDMNLVNQTKCATVEISSDNDCIFNEYGTPGGSGNIPPGQDPIWDNSSVTVTGQCIENYLASFLISNIAEAGIGDMDGSSEYRIFANDTLIYFGNFQLHGGEDIEISQVTNGRAIRLEADQRPGHPGFSTPQETVENCGDFNGSSLGYINTTPLNDLNFNVDIHCIAITAAFDPNNKQVFPSGIGVNNYIYHNNLMLTYLINFQNTGNDTAFNVVIIDTLSNYLDVSSIQPGPASHQYEMQLSSSGVITWTFENIMLPDSTTNEEESKGFVSFKISNITFNAPDDYGKVISNKAEIYFDYNEPIVTNQVDLLYWKIPELITHKPSVDYNDIEVSIYPNPINTEATIKINNSISEFPLEFVLNDINGKQIKSISNINESEFSISFHLLPAGIYFYKITTNNNKFGLGKIILE